MGCPKLDDAMHYVEKLAKIFELNSNQNIHLAIMEVPCCSGLSKIVNQALEISGKKNQIAVKQTILSIDGKIKN